VQPEHQLEPITIGLLKLLPAFSCCTLVMNSPSGDNDTLELFFDPRKQLGTREDSQILQRLSGRAWIDTNRISQLERQVKALRFQFYGLLVLTLVFAIAITMVLVRATWHVHP
jgi:hypothetical protein